MAKKKKKPIDQCKECRPARCCLYMSMEIDKPESRSDFDYLLWKISHKNVSFYIYRRKWYLHVEGRCEHLGRDNKCRIYDRRMKICRTHSIDSCEYTSDEYGFQHHFKTYKQLRDWIKKEYPRWKI